MENKNIRGWIVRILQRAYPAGLEERSLQKQLVALGYSVTKRDLAANLAYLAEDGYVEERKFGNELRDDLLNKTYKLTTKGVDLAEGSATDDGVEI